MSRVTPPIIKLSKPLSQAASRAQASYLSGGTSKTGFGNSQNIFEANHDGMGREMKDPASYLHNFSQPAPNPRRTIPLMQTFHTSTKNQASMDFKPIDFARLPSLDSLYTTSDSYSTHAFRYPLLPDSYHKYAPESPEPSIPDVQSVIVAVNPHKVNAFTEVEGLGVDGVELKFIYDTATNNPLTNGNQEMIKDVWKGLVKDVFDDSGKKLAV